MASEVAGVNPGEAGCLAPARGCSSGAGGSGRGWQIWAAGHAFSPELTETSASRRAGGRIIRTAHFGKWKQTEDYPGSPAEAAAIQTRHDSRSAARRRVATFSWEGGAGRRLAVGVTTRGGDM